MRFLEYLFAFLCPERRQFCIARVNVKAVTPTAKYLSRIAGVLAGLAFLMACAGNLRAQTPVTIWPATATPAVPDVGSDSPVELGVRFYSDTAGYIIGIRFYKSAANTGTHVGNLWSSNGTLLATATFTSESASGWQQVNFSKPVAVAANTAYLASYHSTIGHYSVNGGYFASSSYNNAPLHTYANASSTPEGPYTYGSTSAFPTSTYNSGNYWVDVVFTPTISTQYSIWPSTATPATPDVGSDSPVELGVRFYSDTAGYITGIRFYKSAANTGTHIGNLWSSAGKLLATATFTSETASGWQQVTFSKPVAIAANTAYIASYHSSIGHYSVNGGYFASSGFNNPPLHTYANTSSTPEGPYTYGSTSAFPTSTYNSGNYWVDVTFTEAVNGGGGGGALAVSTTSLPNATMSVAYSHALAASGGTSPYSWSLSSGSLPTGLTLSSAGAISGTPSVAGSFSFTVSVKDSTGASASASLSITVGTAAPPSISISSPSNGSTVSGSISVSGTASDGLTISSVQVSVDGGTFSNASGTTSWSFPLNTNSLSNGAHTLVAKVSDSGGNSASSSLVDITVNNASTSTDCTLYASPSGGGNGTSSSSPLTFSAAASATQPGSVVCLLGGTYNLSSTFVPPNSGSPASWIVYKNYDSTPVNFVWTGAADAEPMFKVGNGSFPSGPAYIQFQGLNLNGSGTAADGFFCRGGHHARFIGNSISDTGGSGIGSINCDYLVADHNLISHNGYIPSSTSVPQDYSWTSAISYNTSEFFDNYTGIHSVISNNIITGEVDQSSNHTDGNGIILDLGGNTPPALIVNNVVYGNGGRCIESNQVQNFYIINNTCFENALDPSEPNFPEFAVNGTSNGYLVNNIAYALSPSNPTFAQYGSVSNTNYSANLYFTGAPNFNATGFMNANPLFLSAPSLAMGGFVSSLLPSLLGSDLTLTPLLSPALGKGIDPSTISGLSASIVSDLKTYIYTDINGKGRPQGGNVDLGAYQQ